MNHEFQQNNLLWYEMYFLVNFTVILIFIISNG